MIDAQVNLVRKHEENLLKQIFDRDSAVPTLILTGFLGSGKTTVVNHILRARGNLRIAVLVNEVGALDVDSLLVNTGENNAAVGIPSANLAGGCACCKLQDDLSASLKQLFEHQQQFDYMVLETSGIGDPEPMAEVLLQHGFHLDAVATVVDAEAADMALGHPVGRAQLEAADMIILNKCDLVSLGGLADLEDRVSAIAPNIRVVRTRFGQAPLESIMDVREVPPPGQGAVSQGELGGLSHDTLPEAPSQWRVGACAADAEGDGLQRKRARIASGAEPRAGGAAAAEGRGEARCRPHSRHHDHNAGVVSVVAESAGLIRLGDLQSFVVDKLAACKGVYRAKGMVWLAERRKSRVTVHFHGLRRFEALVLGPWETPPACQLVLIGTDPAELEWLRGELLSAVVGAAAPEPVAPPTADGTQLLAGLKRLVGEHERFEVVEGACGRGILGFTVVGVPLKSIDGAEVNASVMRAVNKAGKLMVCGEVGAAAAVMHTTGAQQKSRVSTLLVAIPSSGELAALGAVAIWEHILSSARGVLMTAFQHAGGCNCDLGEAFRALAEKRALS